VTGITLLLASISPGQASVNRTLIGARSYATATNYTATSSANDFSPFDTILVNGTPQIKNYRASFWKKRTGDAKSPQWPRPGFESGVRISSGAPAISRIFDAIMPKKRLLQVLTV
jgi:hypothetical protein